MIDLIATKTAITLININHFSDDVSLCIPHRLHLESGEIDDQKSTL